MKAVDRAMVGVVGQWIPLHYGIDAWTDIWPPTPGRYSLAAGMVVSAQLLRSTAGRCLFCDVLLREWLGPSSAVSRLQHVKAVDATTVLAFVTPVPETHRILLCSSRFGGCGATWTEPR